MKLGRLKSLIKNPEIHKFALVGFFGTIEVLSLTFIFTSIFEIFYAISVLMALEIATITIFFITFLF